MKVLLFILFLSIFASSEGVDVPPSPGSSNPAYEPAETCSWNPDVSHASPDHDPGFESNDCLKVDGLTGVHLETIGCQCSASIRVAATFILCDGDPASTIFGTCEEYDFAYRIVAITGSGEMMGEHFFGTATPNAPPPVIFFDRVMDVPCYDLLYFFMESGCACREEVKVVVTEFVEVGDQEMTEAISIENILMPLCGAQEVNAEFTAFCDQECDPDLAAPDTVFVGLH